MSADTLVGVLVVMLAGCWLLAAYARQIVAYIDRLAALRNEAAWEQHVAESVALTERDIYTETLADFQMPPLYTDDDAGDLLAEECAEYLRTNGGAA